MHADRTNRAVLSFVGLLALAVGLGGLLAAGGVFGSKFQHQQLVANRFSHYFGKHGTWLWPAIAAVTLVIVLLSLVWLLRLLFSTDRTRGITVVSSSSEQGDDGESRAGGRTTMSAAALTQAIAQEIESYHGVTGVKARVLGAAGNPTLAIEVAASRRADLAGLIDRIEQQAITHAREALDRADLPVKLDLAVTDKPVARSN